jgi:oligopeptide/dipeptide ABC transporter ATP-binding protein
LRLDQEPLLQTKNLRVDYPTRHGTVRAVNGIDLQLHRSQRLGLVGESGSGKSTMGWALLRSVPWPGRILGDQIVFRGENLLDKTEREMRRIRGSDIALITQSARVGLNPLVKVGKQIRNVYMAHRNASGREARRHVVDMLATVALADPERVADSYLHELSGGMAQRVVIAMALICSPEIIIADEPTTGLDVTVQAQILDLLKDIVDRGSMATIVVTHDLSIIAQYCQTIAVMYAGELIETGPVTNFFEGPVHPYSAALLASSSYDRLDTRHRVKAFAQSPSEQGCAYNRVCPLSLSVCKNTRPTLDNVKDNYFVRCHRAPELLALHNQERAKFILETSKSDCGP